MVSKKDLVIAILSTFCLTLTFFAALPTRSQSREYDPWCDINDDGQIDMIHDIRDVAILFGTSGNSTKNVIVTNFPLDENGNLRIVTATEPQTRNDSVDIHILEFSNGIWCSPAGYPFSFIPKGSQVNITKIWVFLYLSHYHETGEAGAVNITINGVATAQVTDVLLGKGEMMVSMGFEDSSFLNAIKPNRINMLIISLANYENYYYFKQYKITVSIEYEYLA